MRRYSAKLLFQYRVDIAGVSGRMRYVETRITTMHAATARKALASFKKSARSEQASFRNDDGNTVFIEFIGVADMMELGPECEESEVWYEVKPMLTPMERKDRLIPDERQLSAIKLEASARRIRNEQ